MNYRLIGKYNWYKNSLAREDCPQPRRETRGLF
jgi:hypothetical protein